ncbi:HNH endonuclease [Agrococcus sp. SGAir0287]|uniref:HNH endonuclease n=1 Tax=Agrococcus sp. SGAir0287 TaxID=2070347 RepID=UPI0010CD51EB|nr:HNH endonuclease [Agrococcus sp. SGAir0287]QCR18291.1 restriction endonuclease [Agrococcus sp. SGAir0287]
MVTEQQDAAIRSAVFDWLSKRAVSGRSLFTRRELLEDFAFHGERLRLIDVTRGIRNPKELLGTLSVTSGIGGGSVERYTDAIDLISGTIRYDYQRGDGSSNVKLQSAARLGLPIVYFVVVEPGLLAASYPVYVEDVPAERHVRLHVDRVQVPDDGAPGLPAPERSYIERSMWQRVHQPAFRGMVMRAYEERCAICRLAHPRLLDAAHILGDKHELGLPVTSNGLALCKIHHGAYDSDMLGISPDLRVVIPARVLAERDGPMLRHGLQEMHGAALTLPSRAADRPNADHLAERFAAFSAVHA